MAADRSPGPVPFRQLWQIPADLVAVLGVTAVVNAVVFAPIVREIPMLRIPAILVFVLFIPGYAVVAALYPDQGESPPSDESRKSDRSRAGIDGSERVALSIGLSAVIVPIVGFLFTFTSWGIQTGPIAIGITAFSLILTGVAVVRRWTVPEAKRFRVPYETWLAAARSSVLEPTDRADAVLSILLVASVLLAAGSVGFAATNLPQQDDFSTVTLLIEDDGELVADQYPTEFEPGEDQEFVLAIDNHERQTVDYTVVVAEQDAEIRDNETVVHEQRELERFEIQLEHDETRTIEHDIDPTGTDNEVRIVWLVYLDDVPSDPSVDDASYHVHLWGESGATEATTDEG